MSARKLLEYGESREGYWTSERFMKQIEYAVEVAEAKYPKEQGLLSILEYQSEELPRCLQ